MVNDVFSCLDGGNIGGGIDPASALLLNPVVCLLAVVFLSGAAIVAARTGSLDWRAAGLEVAMGTAGGLALHGQTWRIA